MTTAADSGLGRLHPVIVHHLVNSLGWTSLRPLQEEAVAPVLDGKDALLLAPTAGGKTEAAVFPVLTAMEEQRWDGLSVLYVCPLKALLNNLLPRLESYVSWLGRRVALWHGDTTASARRSILATLPDVLLTTPESLESMLVSQMSTTGDCSRDCARLSWTRCTHSAETTAAGTSSPSWNGWPRLPAAPSSGSACQRPSGIPVNCCTGYRAPQDGRGPGWLSHLRQ